MTTAADTATDTRIDYVDLVAQHAPLRERLLDAVARVLDHGQFILGPEVARLEEEWAALCGVDHAVSVGSGTDALVLALHALNIGHGDDVIAPAHSFAASVSAITLVGATPRLVDVGDDHNLDPNQLEACITERTRAIIAVHLTGRPARMNKINEIASRHGIGVIEDAAQAMGARYAGQCVGGLATMSCFSLHPLKTAGACGDAGMITTHDKSMADRLRRLRNHGFERRQEDCAAWGYNSRMDTIQAAMTLMKLPFLEEWTNRRRANAAIYRERLEGRVHIPTDHPQDLAVYHAFPVECDRRDALVEHLSARGISCAVHYRVPIHLLPAAKGLGYQRGDFPVAERIASFVLSLPVHEGLDEPHIHRVCDEIVGFLS